MRVEEGKFYFLKDEYRLNHTKGNIMKTKKNDNYRPYVCVNDPEHPAIKWMVPISSNLKKYSNLLNNNKNANELIKIYHTNEFGNRAFLIQNAVPCFYRDILREYQTKNGNTISLGRKELKDLLKTTKIAIHKLNNNISVGFLSKEIYKDILKTYINQRLISSKNYAILGNEAIKKGITTSLNGYIIELNNKRYEVKKVFLNKARDNINLLTKRGNEKQFSRDVIVNNDIVINDPGVAESSKQKQTLVSKELEMD